MWSPTRRTTLAVCVALLLVTAGCSGGTTPTHTSSPTAATASPTATSSWSPNAAAEQFPPGVAANGTLTNVTALLEAHFEETADEPLALTSEWSGPNESGVRRFVRGANATPYYSTYNRTMDGERITEQFYWTGSHGYARATFDDRTRFSVYQNATAGVQAWTHEDVFGPRSAIRSVLASGNYSVNGTVERGGRTFVRLTADEAAPASSDRYDAYEATALVTPDGVVYDVDATLVRATGEATDARDVSVTLDTSGDWSGPPSWVADLPHLSISPVEDGHALELRNTGGATLPANASFTVAVSNRTVWGSPLHGDVTGTVTTDARLPPGDAVYLTVDQDGGATAFTLHDDRARGEYRVVAAGVRGTRGNVSYRLETGSKDG